MMTKEEQIELLKNLTRDLKSALKAASIGTRFKEAEAAKPKDTKSDGWFTTAGHLGIGDESFVLEVWLDKWVGHEECTLWAGLYSRNVHGLLRIAGTQDKKVRVFTDSDYVESADNLWQLKKTFRTWDKTALEIYDGDDNWFGIYFEYPCSELEKHWDKVISDIRDFLVKIAGCKR